MRPLLSLILALLLGCPTVDDDDTAAGADDDDAADDDDVADDDDAADDDDVADDDDSVDDDDSLDDDDSVDDDDSADDDDVADDDDSGVNDDDSAATDDDDDLVDDDDSGDDDDSADDDDSGANDDDSGANDDDSGANDDDSGADDDDSIDDDDSALPDSDGDGWTADLDCDDADPSVHPGAPLTCVWGGLPVCATSWSGAFTSSAMQPPSSGSDAYVVPATLDRSAAAASVVAALAGDATLALNEATSAGYGLCADGSILLWSAPGSGNAALALRTHPSAAALVVQTPHSFYDLNTMAEGVVVFETVGARALLSSGTHRCGSDTEAGCSGSTSSCSAGSAPYRISDMAHTEESMFQAMHEALADGLPGTSSISLHGFTQSGASVSDGTTQATSPTSLSAQLTDALTAALPAENITSCNDYGAANHDVRLCGTTNAQGRYLNGSADPCGTAASAASGRFIHLEQNLVLRNQPAVIAAAIDAVF